MFNNLIESSSHTREFKRRGSFFLFTTATYALLLLIAGVASIYAYDARLEDQNTEIVTMVGPMELPAPKPVTTASNPRPVSGTNNGHSYAVREDPMASVNRPDIVPDDTSAKPNTNPPVPDRGTWTVGPGNSDSGTSDGPGTPGSGGLGTTPGSSSPVIEIDPPPAPLKIEKAVPKVISKGVINGEALALPKPTYPPIAKQLRIQGVVSVQILIDEGGKVISAKVVSGNPALATAARQAAFDARFSPTRLSNQPVKVSGVITYNFVLQ